MRDLLDDLPPPYGERQPVRGSTEGLAGRIKQANARFEAEDSILLRVLVAIAVITAATAAVREGVGGQGMAILAIVGIPAGHVFSYRTRRLEGMWIKAILAVGILVAFAGFLSEVSQLRPGVVADVQIPLAQLFLWSQIGQAVDLPARRDLLFSLMSSVVLLAVAGVLSVSMAFALHLAVWSVAALAALRVAHRRELERVPAVLPSTTPSTMTRRRAAVGVWRPVVVVVVLVSVLGGIAFMVVPPAGTARALTFPASLPSAIQVPNPGGISNPSLGADDPATRDDPNRAEAGDAASFGYFGFSDKLDTSVRGRPDNSLVMRVRSSAPDFWRGQTFDVWDGRTWSLSDDTVRALNQSSPIDIPSVDPRSFDGRELVQTYYVEEQGPNLVFAAYRATRVYFPDRGLFHMSDGTLRTGVQLAEGAVYTVISRRPVATPESLRESDVFASPPPLVQRYTQLPEVPERVTALARQITAGAPTTYDKVRALEAWMGANTQYSLDIPPLPAGADAVEQFLFVDRKGFCEQIGTSLVVMLRSLGIPARLAVGYAAGERNPFTGLYEVKASDAHSWVEVYFPGLSAWQGFDPTASVPLAGDAGPRTAGSGVLKYLAKVIPTRIPPGVARAVGLLAAVVAVGWSVILWIGVAGRRREEAAAPWPVGFTRRLQAAGEARGRPRRKGQTVTEYVSDLTRSVLPDARLAQVADIVGAEAFSGGPSDRAAQHRAEEILREVEAAWPAGRKPQPTSSRR